MNWRVYERERTLVSIQAQLGYAGAMQLLT